MSEPTTNTPTPDQWKRDDNGLLPFVEYKYNGDGSINWRAMIKPEYLVVNKQAFERRNAKVPESIEGVEDKDLVILLAGIKDLARQRGYLNVTHTPITSTPNYYSVRTTIRWMPNFETNGETITFDSLADASSNNTQGFTKLYLAAIAENRGFVRAVRNFLGVHIAGQDEIGPTVEDESPTQSKGEAAKFLDGILSRNNISFEKFKNRMIKEEVKGADSWESVKDVPSEQVYEVAELVSRLLEAAKQKKQ